MKNLTFKTAYFFCKQEKNMRNYILLIIDTTDSKGSIE